MISMNASLHPVPTVNVITMQMAIRVIVQLAIKDSTAMVRSEIISYQKLIVTLTDHMRQF